MDLTCKEAFQINFLVRDVNDNGWLTYNMCIHTSSDSFQMEKGQPPQDLAPPYPGPPINYGSAPGMFPQPGTNPQPGLAAPPPGYQGGLCRRTAIIQCPDALNDTETLKSTKTTLLFHRLYLEKSIILIKIYSDASLMSWGTLNSFVPVSTACVTSCRCSLLSTSDCRPCNNR